MKTIPLNNELVCLVDDEDFAILSRHKWQLGSNGYVVTCMGQVNVLMHRLVFGSTGGTAIDHRDRNPLNNQKDNLRRCSHSENLTNRTKQKNNTSGYKGVSWHRKNQKWIAQIGKNHTTQFLGLFDDPRDAAMAYDKAAAALHGPFARGNFI